MVNAELGGCVGYMCHGSASVAEDSTGVWKSVNSVHCHDMFKGLSVMGLGPEIYFELGSAEVVDEDEGGLPSASYGTGIVFVVTEHDFEWSDYLKVNSGNCLDS